MIVLNRRYRGFMDLDLCCSDIARILISSVRNLIKNIFIGGEM